jgi:hypothetical protein
MSARRPAAGALVVDIRPVEQRDRDGALVGGVVVDRNVLEWRLDPSSPPSPADLRGGFQAWRRLTETEAGVEYGPEPRSGADTGRLEHDRVEQRQLLGEVATHFVAVAAVQLA